jgi:hypothetical protein
MINENHYHPAFEETMERWILEGRNVYFIDQVPDTIQMSNYTFVPWNTMKIDVPWMANFGDHLPDRIERAKYEFVISRLTKNENESFQKFMEISDGWYALEQWYDGPGRWMKNDSKIFIFSPQDDQITVSFDVGSLSQKRDLLVILNNKTIGNYSVSIRKWPDNTPDTVQIQVQIHKGKNILEFFTPQNTTIPSEIGAWNDTRELSLAFQNIQITPD